MTEQAYSRQVFEVLVDLYGEFAGDFYEVRDDGAWLLPAPLPDIPLFATNWSPACDLEGDDSPDPLSTPAIPFPFSAKRLAAWMLDGWGSVLLTTLGDWASGPDQAQLDRLSPRARKVREVIEAGYRAAREAEAVVGRLDPLLQAGVERALENLHAVESAGAAQRSHAKALESYRIAQRTAEEARVAWRQSMVRHLLTASPAQPAGAPTPLPRQKAQEDAILACLRSLGHDPQALPPLVKGNAPYQVKRDVQRELRYSDEVMSKAWKRLQRAEKDSPGSGIRYASG